MGFLAKPRGILLHPSPGGDRLGKKEAGSTLRTNREVTGKGIPLPYSQEIIRLEELKNHISEGNQTTHLSYKAPTTSHVQMHCF